MALILSTLICPWRRKRNRKLAHNGKCTNTTDLLTLSVSFTEREEQNLQIRLLCGSVVCFNVASSLNKMETVVYEPHMASFFYFNSLSSWKWTSPEGLGGLFYTCGNSWGVGGGGGTSVSCENGKSRKVGVVLSETPSLVGVWIFSGTTQ